MKNIGSALNELDHLMMAVFDHDLAIASFSHLGFQIRPVRQLAPMGGGTAGGNGGSAAILLHSATSGCANYIELARADPATAQPFMKSLLCHKEGPAMLVHATDDPSLLSTQWRNIGLELHEFSFTVQPFGAGEPTDIDIVLPEPGQAPFAFNACRYSDVSDFERDEWRNHPNGAVRWSGLTIAFGTEELQPAVDRFNQIYGVDPLPDNAVHACFQPAANSFELISENQYLASYGQLGFAPIVHLIVKDLDITRRYFTARHIQFADNGNRLMLTPDLCHGAVFSFETS